MATTNSGTTTGKPVNEILTLPEAASYLRVGEDVLRQLASEQKIPARKIGEEWRFLKSALQDWLRRGLPLDDWERWLSLLHAWHGYPVPEVFLDDLARRIVAKLAERPRAERASKQRLLELAGKWQDDPSLDELLEHIYAQRGRPMAGEEE